MKPIHFFNRRHINLAPYLSKYIRAKVCLHTWNHIMRIFEDRVKMEVWVNINQKFKKYTYNTESLEAAWNKL